MRTVAGSAEGVGPGWRWKASSRSPDRTRCPARRLQSWTLIFRNTSPQSPDCRNCRVGASTIPRMTGTVHCPIHLPLTLVRADNRERSKPPTRLTWGRRDARAGCPEPLGSVPWSRTPCITRAEPDSANHARRKDPSNDARRAIQTTDRHARRERRWPHPPRAAVRRVGPCGEGPLRIQPPLTLTQ